jgi:lipopolysaccharide transport system permease protein
MCGHSTDKVANGSHWTMIIKPRMGLFNLNLNDVWRHRDLIGLFVRRDFVSVYKQTVLGPLWFLIQPIANTLVYTVIFGNLAKLSSDGLPRTLFYFSGSMLWQYFSTCVIKTSDTFSANASIFGKVYFPRLTAPISNVVTNLITLGIQFALFLLLLTYFMLTGTPVRPNLAVLGFPLILLCMAALGLGTGIIVSSITTKYRDLRQLISFGVHLWMYATPVVYPLSQVPEKWRWIIILNPMTPLLEGFRFAFLGTGTVDPRYFVIGGAATLSILFLGILMFNRVERTFMDVV